MLAGKTSPFHLFTSPLAMFLVRNKNEVKIPVDRTSGRSNFQRILGRTEEAMPNKCSKKDSHPDFVGQLWLFCLHHHFLLNIMCSSRRTRRYRQTSSTTTPPASKTEEGTVFISDAAPAAAAACPRPLFATGGSIGGRCNSARAP